MQLVGRVLPTCFGQSVWRICVVSSGMASAVSGERLSGRGFVLTANEDQCGGFRSLTLIAPVT